jgi:hypothetical protein
VEVRTDGVAKEWCNLPAYSCCLSCSADPLCLAFSKIPEGDSDKCLLVMRVPLNREVELTNLQQDRESFYVAAKESSSFGWERVVGAVSGVPLDQLPSGNIYIYIYIYIYIKTHTHTHTHTNIYTYTYTYTHMCVYITCV